MRAVRGDGHCLFRAVTGQMVEKFANSIAEEQTQFQSKLAATMTGLKGSVDLEVAAIERQKAPSGPLDQPTVDTRKTEVQNRFNELERSYTQFTQEFLPKIQRREITAEKLLNTQASSDSIVHFYRQLASEWNRQKPDNDAYRTEAARVSGSFETYDKNMRDMRRAEMGGTDELRAIAAATGVNILVEDAKVCGEKNRDYEYSIGDAPKTRQNEVVVLYRPGHYDALTRKPPRS